MQIFQRYEVKNITSNLDIFIQAADSAKKNRPQAESANWEFPSPETSFKLLKTDRTPPKSVKNAVSFDTLACLSVEIKSNLLPNSLF